MAHTNFPTLLIWILAVVGGTGEVIKLEPSFVSKLPVWRPVLLQLDMRL